MILLAAFLLGGTFGVGLWLYISGFITRLQADIYNNYIELFPKKRPLFQPHFATIQQKKCGHILRYFFITGFLCALLTALAENPLFALWLGGILILLWAIAYLDWQYQLISPTPCLWLLAFGLFGAAQSFSPLTLEQSLQSAVIFFLIFYGIYWIAKWYYQKEAFGQGDYWLALGIGSYLPLEDLPLFLFIASALGILLAIFSKRKDNFLPFAPFLCLAVLVVFSLNY
ncbi:prepilin peptidase [Rodentibacter myodis]|uniref:Prepilin peptidase n=1 Tax=Rodentibacter myodis TaxID=1907939 RepID=A0A1V3JTQ9_9PAST|nr:A24 family peptidase [Rodentibacter myodis]OOF60192.1 prepilin peptidase [Rodentibacter myodis]